MDSSDECPGIYFWAYRVRRATARSNRSGDGSSRVSPTVRKANRLENGDISLYVLMWRGVSAEVRCSLTYHIKVGNKRRRMRPSMAVPVADVAGPSQHEVAG